MELTRAGSAVLRRIYLLVLGAVVVAAGAYVWSARRQPTYEATAQVVVLVHVGATITTLHLDLTQKLARQYAAQALPDVVIQSIQQAVPARSPTAIRAEVSASAVSGQSLIDINARDASAATAIALSNAAALSFVNYYTQQAAAAEDALAQQETSLQTRLQQINGKIRSTQTALSAAKAQGNDTTALQAQLTTLQTQQTQISDQLTTVTQQRSAPLADFWVASQATTAPRLTADPRVNALFGAVAGLFAGLCAALLLDLLDGTVRRPSDTMRFAGLSTLQSLPTSPGDTDDAPAPVREAEYVAVAGGYATLRRDLAFLSAPRSLQSLLIAPAGATVGMDQVGVHLAITYAAAGARTLIIDANWSRPTLEARFGLRNIQQGLFTSLVALASDPAAAFGAILPTPVTNLFALPVGPLPPNLTELVQSSLLDKLNAALMGEFEQILVLAPSNLRETAGRHLIERMDGALVVTRAGVTSGRELAEVAQALRRANAYIAGAVLLMPSQESVPAPRATPDHVPPSASADDARPAPVVATAPAPSGTPDTGALEAKLTQGRAHHAVDQ